MAKYEPFNPADPVEQMADLFRRQIAEIALGALEAPMYRSLKPSEQVGAMMAGTLTGLIGVLFAQCEPDVHNDLMKAIKSYLPQARVQAEGIIAADSSSVKNSEG